MQYTYEKGISTVYSLIFRYESNQTVKDKIRKFKVIADTSELTDRIIDKGLSSPFSDFDDSSQYYCAVEADGNIIITRNGKDFKDSVIPVMTPDEYLNSICVLRGSGFSDYQTSIDPGIWQS